MTPIKLKINIQCKILSIKVTNKYLNFVLFTISPHNKQFQMGNSCSLNSSLVPIKGRVIKQTRPVEDDTKFMVHFFVYYHL